MKNVNTLSELELNKRQSATLGCAVPNFHFHENEIMAKGFWFIVPTELDAYKSAYTYQHRATKITKQLSGGWLVSIGGDKL